MPMPLELQTRAAGKFLLKTARQPKNEIQKVFTSTRRYRLLKTNTGVLEGVHARRAAAHHHQRPGGGSGGSGHLMSSSSTKYLRRMSASSTVYVTPRQSSARREHARTTSQREAAQKKKGCGRAERAQSLTVARLHEPSVRYVSTFEFTGYLPLQQSARLRLRPPPMLSESCGESRQAQR